MEYCEQKLRDFVYWRSDLLYKVLYDRKNRP